VFILSESRGSFLVKLIFAGPCGVGKSTIARLIEAQFENIKYLDLDTIRAQSYEKYKGQLSPCSLHSLDLKKCLESTLNLYSTGFILDIGGTTIFRHKANNEERIEQIGWIKENYGAFVVVLVADKSILYQRFQSAKAGRTMDEFEEVWEYWQMIEEQNWKRCEDCRIDTTSFVLTEKELQLPAGFLQLLDNCF
jgi:shikimate kinase